MRKRIFCDRYHLHDIRLKRIFNLFEVDVYQVATRILLGCIVDEYIQCSMAVIYVLAQYLAA